MLRRRIPLLSLAIAAVAAGAPRLGTGPVSGADPKDGPDVDVRAAIEDDGVHVQIVTNLAFLDATCDVSRELPESLGGPEIEAAREALFALFAGANRVVIDGVERAPLDVGFAVDAGDESLYAHFPRFGARAVFKTRLELHYPAAEPPSRVALAWGVFPPDATAPPDPRDPATLRVLCRLSAHGVEQVVELTAEEPEFTWHAPPAGTTHLAPVPELAPSERRPFPFGWLAAAAAAIALAWRGPRPLRWLAGPLAVMLAVLATLLATEDAATRLPTEDEALAVFRPLHTNIYRAFDYTDEEDVYDALATSVAGDLLDRLYDEVYRSLVLQEAGGAVSRVDRVRYLDLSVVELGVLELAAPEAAAAAGFRVAALWQVDGSVYHWGHAHSRTNEYRAEYTVAAAEAGWRILDSRMIEQRRVDAAPLAPAGRGY